MKITVQIVKRAVRTVTENTFLFGIATDAVRKMWIFSIMTVKNFAKNAYLKHCQ